MRLNYVKAVTPAFTGTAGTFKWNDFYNQYIYEAPLSSSDLSAFISQITSRINSVDPSLPPLETFSSDLDWRWFSGFAAHISGAPSITPARTFELPAIREGKANKDFKRRSRKGEIIMSPYKLSKGTITFENGRSVAPIKNLGCNVYGPAKHQILSPFPVFKGKDGQMWCDLGSGLVTNPPLQVEREIGDVEFSITPEFLGVTESSVQDLFQSKPSPADPAWVQSVIADANKRAIDWMTALAELPEAVKYIYSAFSSLGSILKSWKSKEETIRQTFKRKGTELQKQIAETLSLLGKAKAKTIIRRLRKKLRSLNLRYSRLGKELISALASAWMQYRYVIMPAIYTVEDGIKALKNYKYEYFKTYDKLITEGPAPHLGDDWDFEGTCVTTARTTLKYKYSPFQGIGDFSRVASGNAALTLWELKSKSFVWDWFFTVGDFLSAGFGKPSNTLDQKMSVSYEQKTVGVYAHKTTGAKVYVDCLTYVRTTPDPSSFLGIYFRKNLNWMRYTDAFAMLWPTLRKSIK